MEFQSTRIDIMLFLLMQITIASPTHGPNVGLSNPWTEYAKMLPDSVPVPTLWTAEEQVMLLGTSLEVCFRFLRSLYCDSPLQFLCWNGRNGRRVEWPHSWDLERIPPSQSSLKVGAFADI